MERTRVRDIMSSPAITVSPDTTLPAANALMKEKQIRHLPVLEKGRLVGIVSRGDLREASISASINADQYELHFLLNKLTVGKLMTRKVRTVMPGRAGGGRRRSDDRAQDRRTAGGGRGRRRDRDRHRIRSAQDARAQAACG